jgi:hypothetical protein
MDKLKNRSFYVDADDKKWQIKILKTPNVPYLEKIGSDKKVIFLKKMEE